MIRVTRTTRRAVDLLWGVEGSDTKAVYAWGRVANGDFVGQPAFVSGNVYLPEHNIALRSLTAETIYGISGQLIESTREDIVDHFDLFTFSTYGSIRITKSDISSVEDGFQFDIETDIPAQLELKALSLPRKPNLYVNSDFLTVWNITVDRLQPDTLYRLQATFTQTNGYIFIITVGVTTKPKTGSGIILPNIFEYLKLAAQTGADMSPGGFKDLIRTLAKILRTTPLSTFNPRAADLTPIQLAKFQDLTVLQIVEAKAEIGHFINLIYKFMRFENLLEHFPADAANGLTDLSKQQKIGILLFIKQTVDTVALQATIAGIRKTILDINAVGLIPDPHLLRNTYNNTGPDTLPPIPDIVQQINDLIL